MTTTTTATGGAKIDLNKLEELAREATPGPWSWASDWSRAAVYANHSPYTRVVCSGNQNNDARYKEEPWSGASHTDAAFIAAANPSAVLDLIALARATQQASAAPQAPAAISDRMLNEHAFTSNLTYLIYCDEHADLIAENERLRAELASVREDADQMRALLADAWTYVKDGGGDTEAIDSALAARAQLTNTTETGK